MRLCSNIVNVFVRLYTCGLFSSACCYGFLVILVKSLSEFDFMFMFILFCIVGNCLCLEDLVGMKEFILVL